MALQAEVGARRAPRAHHQTRKKQKRVRQPFVVLPALLNDDQVLTFREWCQLNRFSTRTGQRVVARGDGPAVTELSAKRIGITVGANREWQASRKRVRGVAAS
jgi:hypothetical protein